MLIQTLRMVTAALNSPTYGVNVQLDNVERDGDDGVPPQVVTITDEASNNALSLGKVLQDATQLPALMVTLDAPFDVNALNVNGYRDGEIPLVISYIAKDCESAQAFADASYTIEATKLALDTWAKNIHASDRTRGNILVIEPTTMTYQKHQPQIADSYITDALKVTYLVRAVENS